jgi:hypothetical protein
VTALVRTPSELAVVLFPPGFGTLQPADNIRFGTVDYMEVPFARPATTTLFGEFTPDELNNDELMWLDDPVSSDSLSATPSPPDDDENVGVLFPHIPEADVAEVLEVEEVHPEPVRQPVEVMPAIAEDPAPVQAVPVDREGRYVDREAEVEDGAPAPDRSGGMFPDPPGWLTLPPVTRWLSEWKWLLPLVLAVGVGAATRHRGLTTSSFGVGLVLARLIPHQVVSIPDLETEVRQQCERAGVDTELVAHLLLNSSFSPRDARRATELARKATQWMHQNRKNWSNLVMYSQQTRAVGIALQASTGELAALESWYPRGVLSLIGKVDKFARSGQLGWGRGLPQV